MMEKCEVGLWRLPGLRFGPEMDQEEALVEEMQAWAKENECGFYANPRLWSFRTEAQRDWFVLRWSDCLPKGENND
jgi:hypothetical protein